MIPIEYFILIAISSPLLVCLTTPFLSGKPLLRDSLGPIGGIVSSWSSIELVQAVLNGAQPRLEVLQIAEGVSIGFTVTPLGALFGLVASVLWIFAGIYSVGYMRGNNEKNQKIKMTVPVTVVEKSGNTTMQFYLPSKFDKNNIPNPTASDLSLIHI